MEGWIKLHREIQQHWIFKNPIFLQRWLIMLLKSNHIDKKISLGYDLFTIKTGQSAYSLRTWSSMFECGTKQTIRFFNMLESDGMITRKTIGKGKQSTTLININNYEQYQTQKETQEDTQGERKGNARGIQLKNDKNYNKYYTDNFLLSEVEQIDSSKLTAKNKLSYHILTGLVARVYKEIDEKLKTKMTAEPIVDTIRKLIKIDKFSDKDIILVLAYLKFKDKFWLTQGMPSFASARKKKDGQTKFEKIHFKASSETKRDEQFYEKVKKQIQWYEIQLNK